MGATRPVTLGARHYQLGVLVTRVNLDAMIPRADFAALGDDYTLDLFQNFPITNLEQRSPIFSLLRKPDFQRETNHWTPLQITTFIASFLDNELIPSLILWKSPSHIFIIDGGHRLGALKAWMEDDYGDGHISQRFYGGEISDDQKNASKKVRTLIEKNIGRYTFLKGLVENPSVGSEVQARRARNLFTRALNLQWVQGTASVAETSFFKINSQGTPLDDTEEMLLKNRKKPIAIGARAIVRAGYGHKYWSAFDIAIQRKIEEVAKDLYNTLFEPEVDQPIRTLDLPLAGSSSPLEALSVLVELLAICDLSFTQQGDLPADIQKGITSYADDTDGSTTVRALENTLRVISRMTGNGKGSLGLHPAVFFYNDKGKHSRFLFLGMVAVLAKRLSNNDSHFFKKFTKVRRKVEDFLITNKSLINLFLQNVNKHQRVSKMASLFEFLIREFENQEEVPVNEALAQLGARGRVLDITSNSGPIAFSDDTKSSIFLKRAINTALRCPECDGLLDPTKSVSYDHVQRVREGGLGHEDNGQLAHPYCDQSVKN
jgi:Protein of unknown function DUF262